MTRSINDLSKFARIAREEMLKCNEKLVVDDMIPVTLNPRLSRSLGRCGTSLRNGCIVDQRIEIQTAYYLSDNISDHHLVGTLIHEYLHSLYPCDHHGGHWAYWADYISSHSDYKITRVSDDIGNYRTDYSKFKYALICPTCNQILQVYKSKSKQILYPHNYEHSSCHTICESKAITTEFLESLKSPIEVSKPKEKLPHPEQLSLSL